MKNPARPLQSDASGGYFHTVGDGTSIFVHTRQPAREAAATVYVLSGITGINHQSDADVIDLLEDGKNRVVVIHPRGTGYSEGKRGDIRRFSRFLDDYAEIIDQDLHSGKCQGKVILFGHSMSAAVVLNVAEKIGRVDGAILVNPPIRMKRASGMSPGIRAYLKYAFYFIFAPHTPVVNMAGNPAQIQDPVERADAEARGRDPLLVKYFSLYYMNQSRKMMAGMMDLARHADYPLLLVYGNRDGIVDQSGCDALFAAWKNPHKQYAVVNNGPHGKLTVLLARNIIQGWINGL